MSGWHKLANAIIECAAADYLSAVRMLREYPQSYTAKAKKTECEKFFRSEWFIALSNCDGEGLLQALWRASQNGMKMRRSWDT